MLAGKWRHYIFGCLPVGLCRVLSNIGANDLAYTLLLNEDFPS
jgi:hypothetical protein